MAWSMSGTLACLCRAEHGRENGCRLLCRPFARTASRDDLENARRVGQPTQPYPMILLLTFSVVTLKLKRHIMETCSFGTSKIAILLNDSERYCGSMGDRVAVQWTGL